MITRVLATGLLAGLFAGLAIATLQSFTTNGSSSRLRFTRSPTPSRALPSRLALTCCQAAPS